MPRLPISVAPDGSGARYEVKRGDTLYGLIQASGTLAATVPKDAIALVMQDNTHIKNADEIYPGDLIFIRNRSIASRPLSPVTLKDIIAAHRELPSVAQLNAGGASGIDWAAMSATVSFAASNAATQQLAHLHSQTAQPVRSIIDSYRQMKAGDVARDVHYQARTSHIQNISRNLGPLEKNILGGAANRQLRMTGGGVAKGVDRTAPMRKQATRLKTTARNLSRGGAALNVMSVVVDAGFTHYAVCTADDSVEKNEAFLSGMAGTVGGFAGGAAGGAVASAAVTAGFLFFIGSNPAGWVVGLAIIGGSAVGGGLGAAASSAAAVKVYDEFGNGYDVVDTIPINGGCSLWGT